MYLTKDDILSGMYEEHLIAIARNDDIIINTGIKYAIGEARAYLTAKYDMDEELTKTGDERNDLLVGIIKSIAIWKIYATSSPINMPDIRQEEYTNAIRLLKDAQAERATIDNLKQKVDPINGGSTYVRFGGNKPRKNHY